MHTIKLLDDLKNKNECQELISIIHTIANTCITISEKVRSNTHLGITGNTNVHSENVQKLDIIANNLLISALQNDVNIGTLISEENSDPIERSGKYTIAFDPLDGSSNIDCNGCIGTIFGIYDTDKMNIITAGYILYGSATVMMLSMLHKGVNGYTLVDKEFYLSHHNVTIGHKKIFSINEGLNMPLKIKNYINTLKDQKYSARYTGSMVADIHRTLLYGGIFLYPLSKLRLLYECIPMAMIIEEAGGAASNGKIRILDVVPKHIHDTSPIFIGNISNVEEFSFCV